MESKKRGRPPLPVDAPPPSGLRLLTYRELKAVKGIPFSRSELRRKESKGSFPRHITLGDGLNPTIAWVEAEIDDYIAGRMQAREVPPAGAHPEPTLDAISNARRP
jgi:predicted DNA-binding transcriptional regulator AlpA